MNLSSMERHSLNGTELLGSKHPVFSTLRPISNKNIFLYWTILISFSKMAAVYTAEQWQKDLIEKITAFVRANVSWIGAEFITPDTPTELSGSQAYRVLDYACGPGTMTNALRSHAVEYLGVDLSQNMVNSYNSRFSSEADGELLNARAVVGNILDEEGSHAFSSPESANFDLAVVGMAFHHFEDVELVTKRLANRLKPGGIFLVLDFVTHAKEDSPAAHTISHHGFGEHEVRKIFAGAGLVDIGFMEMDGQVQMKSISPRTPFLARGRKP